MVPGWKPGGFHILAPPPTPISISVAHAITDNILVFLATAQYDLGG